MNNIFGKLFQSQKEKSKKKTHLPPVSLESIKTDIHSHLIPGLDDGVENIDEALEIIRSMISFGYRKLITTPHIMIDAYPNSSDYIKTEFNKLKQEVENAKLDIELDFAAEYYVDKHFEELIDQGDILTLGDKHVLFEFSYLNRPINYKNVLIKLFEKGYKPILAHPERYIFLQNNKKEYDELKDMGVEFQLNMFSLIGAYDRASQYHARRLIEKGMVDYIGTDIHRKRQLRWLKSSLRSRYLHHLINQFQLKNLFLNT